MKDTFQDWWDKASRYSLQTLNIGGNAASIIGILVVWFRGQDTNRVFPYYLIFVTSLLAGTLILREIQTARRLSYGEVLAPVHNAVHYVRDTLHLISGLDEKDFATVHVSRVLNDLATAMSIVTGTSCRASIKVVAGDNRIEDLGAMSSKERARHLLVRTFARDTINPLGPERERADFLSDNSDLRDLFQDRNRRVFFSNDLHQLYRKGGYRNSHLPDEAFEKWPLPYKSSIVWPIRRVGGTSALSQDADFLGFLCVDSPMTNVFVSRYDFEIGAMIADTLYCYMKANADRPKAGEAHA